MSAPAPPAPSEQFPVATDDGLGIAELLELLGLEPAADAGPLEEGPVLLRPADAVVAVRGWVRRAADWGSGPQRSWCAW